MVFFTTRRTRSIYPNGAPNIINVLCSTVAWTRALALSAVRSIMFDPKTLLLQLKRYPCAGEVFRGRALSEKSIFDAQHERSSHVVPFENVPENRS